MSDRRVAAIIPCFNSARFVGDAIAAALAQTYRDIDVVVVDDGSTDAFDEAVRPFADRIRVVRQANRGLAGARNTGIEATDADLIALLDADDRWQPDKIARQVAFLDQHPDHVLVYTARRAIDEFGRPMPDHHGWASVRHVEGHCLKALVSGNTIQPSSAMVRRNALGAERFSAETYGCEDWDLWLRLAHVGAFGFIPDALTEYRYHSSNMSGQQEKMSRGFLAAMERAYQREAGRAPADITAAIRHHRDGLRCAVGHHAYERGDMSEARRRFREGWRALSWLGAVRFSLAYVPEAARRRLRGGWQRVRPAP